MAAANHRRDEAQLANAKLDLARAAKLLSLGAATGRSVDALKAQVAALSATIAADDADLAAARLDLEFTTIRSPIRGRVGLRQVNHGAFVRTADTVGIVTITQLAPIAVLFALPQDALAALGRLPDNVAVTVAGAGSGRDLANGKLAMIDSQVDATNGQIRLKAVFPNVDHTLWPGTLVSARVAIGHLANAITVPIGAIQSSQAGSFVYLVKPDGTVLSRQVKTGPTVAGTTAVLSGVEPGQIVVVSGQSRITDGTHVTPRKT